MKQLIIFDQFIAYKESLKSFFVKAILENVRDTKLDVIISSLN